MTTSNSFLDYAIYTAGFTFVTVVGLNKVLLKTFFQQTLAKPRSASLHSDLNQMFNKTRANPDDISVIRCLRTGGRWHSPTISNWEFKGEGER